jgi:hypothetical protein
MRLPYLDETTVSTQGDTRSRRCRSRIASPRERAKERLAILEVLRAATERRREVVEAVWGFIQRRSGELRLHELVDFPDGLSAQLNFDQQIRLFTKEKRDELTAEISRPRKLVQDPSE